jgi:transcriptional regulator with XRE-family HTH domain
MPEDHPADIARHKVRLGPAIRQARGDMTQTTLADAVGVDQPTVSRWERDEQRPSLEQLAAVDAATGRRRGFVLIAAGLVEGVQSVEAALALDPSLDDEQRRFVLNAYRAGVVQSGKRG